MSYEINVDELLEQLRLRINIPYSRYEVERDIDPLTPEERKAIMVLLSNNYNYVTPTAYQQPLPSREVLYQLYKSDARRLSKLNEISRINHHTNIRLTTFNVKDWEYITEDSKIFEHLSPDILALQEDTNEHHNHLKAYSEVVHAPTTESIGNSIYSKYVMVDKFRMNLPSITEGSPTRTMVYAKFSILFDDNLVIPLNVICTHLDVYDSTGLTRRLQAQSIMAFVRGKIPAEEPIILMGDFNALRRDDYNDTERQWLGDVDYDTIPIFEKRGFRVSFPGLVYSVWSARRVDYIMTRNCHQFYIKPFVHYSTESDHFALTIDISKELRLKSEIEDNK